MKPITPDEVVTAQTRQIPDYVIESFNEMIALNWNGFSSRFKTEDVKKLAITKRPTPLDHRWLNVEDIYRAAGWDVEYDAPAYNETYPATFEFCKKRS